MASPDFVERGTERRGEELVLHLEVPTDLVFFEGHFEGNPMLPGVAQLVSLVDARARRHFADALEGMGARRVSRLKFQATVRPGEQLELGLTLVPGEEPQVRFRIDRLVGETCETASSGALGYGRAPTQS
jgi:3-hydroxymyristoyl/3-hydroxydecanoyl-(acyl carrier protein) dehydratase